VEYSRDAQRHTLDLVSAASLVRLR
jgi:hypothetical protein